MRPRIEGFPSMPKVHKFGLTIPMTVMIVSFLPIATNGPCLIPSDLRFIV
jgi:hypothetical protein